MIEKIYFDLDNTLADFNKGVIDHGGKVCEQKPDIDDSEMWDTVRNTAHFYAILDYMPGAHELFDKVLKEFGEDKVEILTGVPKPKRNIQGAKEDKERWVREKLSKTIKFNSCLKEEKQQYCNGKNYILIDDLEDNCKRWEELGGTAIKYLDADETYKKIMEINKINEG